MIKIYGLQIQEYYDFISPLKTEKDVDIYIDTEEYHQNDNMKIYIQSEPIEILNCVDYLKNNYFKYDYILRYDDTIINFPNCITNYCGSSWIKDLTNDISIKSFKISVLSGHKLLTYAHHLRRELYNRQLEFAEYPVTFFRSGAHWEILPDINNNPILPKSLDSKIELFKNYQFSIVIENTRERNCFSEKIIDCLITKTIPIYYGCNNIHDFFDTSCWIILESNDIVTELKQKLKILDSDYYNNNINIVEENYKKAHQYADWAKVKVDILTKIPGISRKE